MQFPWQLIIAGFINTTLVLIIVSVLQKWVLPSLREIAPWFIPILASAVGPIMALIQNGLSGLLGIAIDLSPIIGIFTGATAVAAHQIGTQYRKALAFHRKLLSVTARRAG